MGKWHLQTVEGRLDQRQPLECVSQVSEFSFASYIKLVLSGSARERGSRETRTTGWDVPYYGDVEPVITCTSADYNSNTRSSSPERFQLQLLQPQQPPLRGHNCEMRISIAAPHVDPGCTKIARASYDRQIAIYCHTDQRRARQPIGNWAAAVGLRATC